MQQEKGYTEISVIMANYNRTHLTEESLNYSTAQNCNDFDCLIIDDGSIDHTTETVASFSLHDFRFKYFKGKCRYRKRLPGYHIYDLDLANRKYIVFFDGYDIPHPNLSEWSVNENKTHNINYCRYPLTVFTNEFKRELELNPNYKLKKLNSGSA